MKYCPICKTRYDEEILRFCMKDGTPLVEEEEPNFIEMPSEGIDEPENDDGDEVTIIRNNVPPPAPQSAIDEMPQARPSAHRIVVPTVDDPGLSPRVRAIPYQTPPPPNTAKVVVLTIIGTVAVLALGALGFRFLQNDPADNSFINTNFNSSIENVNTNLNTNIGLDSNFNFNLNANFNTNSLSNLNMNVNANLRTPTPTPTPRPSPSETPSPTPEDNDTPTPTPTRSPLPTQTPIVVGPSPSPTVPRMNPRPVNRPANTNLSGGG